MTSTLCSQAVDAALINFLEVEKAKQNKKNHNSEDIIRTAQSIPTRERMLCLTFSAAFTINWRPYMSGKRQFLCILFRKSLVDIHSCLTERQKIPMESKIAGLVV